jgi:hypothetical protein
VFAAATYDAMRKDRRRVFYLRERAGPVPREAR